MTALAIEAEHMPTKHSHRINLNIDPDLYKWVTKQRFVDHMTTSDRIRALLELCREDPGLNERVAAKASELAEARAETQ